MHVELLGVFFFFFFFSIRPCLDDCPYWTSKFSVILWGFCIYSINNSINSKPVTNHLSWVEIFQSKGNLLGVNVLGTVAIGGKPDIFCVKCNFLWRLELSTRQQASPFQYCSGMASCLPCSCQPKALDFAGFYITCGSPMLWRARCLH